MASGKAELTTNTLVLFSLRTLLRYLFFAIVLIAGYAMLEPFLARALYSVRLSSMPAPAALPVPVAGVTAASIRDSWYAPRDGGRRRHEGIDIFAPRGTAVHATTEGIVLRIGTSKLGGKVVWVLGPGGQRHYFAHLDRFAGVQAGMRVKPGTVLGYVGDSGNAAGTPPHLHYGIYTATGAINPYPLLGSVAR